MCSMRVRCSGDSEGTSAATGWGGGLAFGDLGFATGRDFAAAARFGVAFFVAAFLAGAAFTGDFFATARFPAAFGGALARLAATVFFAAFEGFFFIRLA